jgi:Fe-S-cluster containining protein
MLPIDRARSTDQTTAGDELPAGRFSSWLVQIGQASSAGVEVPCGTCTACCTSSQFIHIEADEVGTTSQIPSALLFPAPGRPKGDVVMGYDERGHCPMFVDGGCSIYEHRPRTCRSYDCRVLAAAGVELDDETKAQITERTRRWRFDYPSQQDHQLQAAVRTAATFLREHADQLPPGAVPRNRPQLAFLAVQVHEVFLAENEPSLEEVAAAISRGRT